MFNSKSPENSDLSRESCKSVWYYFKEPYVMSIKQVFHKKASSTLQRQAIIRPIGK